MHTGSWICEASCRLKMTAGGHVVSQVWWHRPVIPALREWEAGGLQIGLG